MQVPESFTLPKNIAAIQLQHTEDGEERLGVISQLPRDAHLRVCGDGFNSRTVKVRCLGHYYFVFLQDIEPSELDAD
jgi:hypothetical protein